MKLKVKQRKLNDAPIVKEPSTMKIFDEPLKAKRKRFNKNKKKAWRTKINITDVEDAIEDKRREERYGGPLEEKLSEDLFSLDCKPNTVKVNEPKERIYQASEKGLKRKTRKGKAVLKSQQFLNGLPGVKAISKKKGTVKQRENILIRAAKKECMKESSNPLKADIKKPKYGKKYKRKIEDKTKTYVKEDVWNRVNKDLDRFGEVGKTYMKEPVNYFKEQTKKRPVRLPPSLAKFEKSSTLPAVVPPKGGASYNPSFEDHQKLLMKAVNSEKKKLKHEDKALRLIQRHIPTRSQGLTERQILKEMSEGLPLNSNHLNHNYVEKEEYNVDQEETGDNLSCGQKRVEKKSQQSRKKAMTLKILEEKRLKKKEINRLQAEVFKVNSYQKDLAESDEKRKKVLLARKKKLIVKQAQTKKLSKYRFEENDVLVPFGTELPDNLRTLKPVPANLDDVFKNLQRRNIIETKSLKRAKRSKAKVKMVMERNKKKEMKEFAGSLGLEFEP